MLILIVEGLTCICTINDILIHISPLKKTPHRCICDCRFYPKWVFIHSIPEFDPGHFSPLSLLLLLLCHHSQIKVLDGEDEYYKLLSTVESIPEEECATTPPPTLQSWASHPCQPVRQTHQTCRQTLQRASSVLDVLRHMEQVQQTFAVNPPCSREGRSVFCNLVVEQQRFNSSWCLIARHLSFEWDPPLLLDLPLWGLTVIFCCTKHCCETIQILLHPINKWETLHAAQSAAGGQVSLVNKTICNVTVKHLSAELQLWVRCLNSVWAYYYL